MKLKKVILTAAATAFILQASAYAADLTASYSMDDMTGFTYDQTFLLSDTEDVIFCSF